MAEVFKKKRWNAKVESPLLGGGAVYLSSNDKRALLAHVAAILQWTGEGTQVNSSTREAVTKLYKSEGKATWEQPTTRRKAWIW